MASAVPGGEIGQVDPGRVGQSERLGDGERSLDELALGRKQLGFHARAGELPQGEQRLEPGHPAPSDDYVKGVLAAPLDHREGQFRGGSTAPPPPTWPPTPPRPRT